MNRVTALRLGVSALALATATSGGWWLWLWNQGGSAAANVRMLQSQVFAEESMVTQLQRKLASSPRSKPVAQKHFRDQASVLQEINTWVNASGVVVQTVSFSGPAATGQQGSLAAAVPQTAIKVAVTNGSPISVQVQGTLKELSEFLDNVQGDNGVTLQSQSLTLPQINKVGVLSVSVAFSS